MTSEEILDIKNRVQSASKGPWKSFVEGRDHESGDSFIMTGIGDSEQNWFSEGRGEDIYLTGATINDQDFIANARQDIPKLLHYIQELETEIDNLKNQK